MNPLERRYRRLLLAYPADHRREHGEEMLGVLLDDAAPGSTRPDLRATADLLRGAARIRVARADARGWGDGLAVVSLVTTALACLWAPAMLAIAIYGNPLPLTTVVPFLIWPVVLVVGLSGMRRTAALLSCAGALAWTVSGFAFDFEVGGGWEALGLTAALTAVSSPGIRRGAQTVGIGRSLLLLTGAGLLSGLFLAQAYVYGPAHDGPLPGRNFPGPLPAWVTVTAGLLLVAVAILRVGTPAARRSTFVLAAPLALVTVMLAQETAMFSPRLNVLYSHGTLANASSVAAGLLAAALAATFASRRQRQSFDA